MKQSSFLQVSAPFCGLSRVSRGIIASSLALVGSFVTGFAGCSAIGERLIEKPKVAFHSVNLRDIGGGGATVVFGVQVENPNSFALTVDQLRYDIEIAGKALASGQLKEPARVPAQQTAVVEIPVPVKYSDVFNSVLELMSKGTSQYRVKGDATMGLFTLPFDQTGELNFRK